MADRTLNVTVLKGEAVFLRGAFTVAEADYPIVAGLLPEMGLDRGRAAAILAGYMHARDVGPTTEAMGKLAMAAAVFLLEAGETAIAVPLNAPTAH